MSIVIYIILIKTFYSVHLKDKESKLRIQLEYKNK